MSKERHKIVLNYSTTVLELTVNFSKSKRGRIAVLYQKSSRCLNCNPVKISGKGW